MAKLAGPQEILFQFRSVVGAMCEKEDIKLFTKEAT
jgi:hypothetical protein